MMPTGLAWPMNNTLDRCAAICALAGRSDAPRSGVLSDKAHPADSSLVGSATVGSAAASLSVMVLHFGAQRPFCQSPRLECLAENAPFTVFWGRARVQPRAEGARAARPR